MVAYDVIIYPGKNLTIEVRCVEQGRWDRGDKKFRSAGAMGGRKTKNAVQLYDQERVWKEVAKENAINNEAPSTGTYLAAMTNEDVQKKYEEYAKVFLPSLSAGPVSNSPCARANIANRTSKENFPPR
jgi:hypothetical protein